MELITIDGAQGEGGGQILRSALALSVMTGRSFLLQNVRAKRSRPGLLRQHLTAVQAAAQVGEALTVGAELGSRTLEFRPQGLQPGDFSFSMGTAGSTTLVLQTILPPLLTASGLSTVTLEGGTHNPFAPPFTFLARAFLPIIGRMGPRVTPRLERHGFYPAGGGRFAICIEPCERLLPIELLTRGQLLARQVTALISNLPHSIGARELKAAKEFLDWPWEDFREETIQGCPGPGNILSIELESEEVVEVFTGFGEKGKPAEEVALVAARQAKAYLESDAPVGPYLADQLLLPMASAGGGAFRTLELTGHFKTNIEIIKKFLEIKIQTVQEDKGWLVQIG